MADINRYKSRIVIQSPTLTANTFGGYATTYATLCVVWALIVPLTSREDIKYKQLYPSATYRVQMRYRSDISQGCKVYYRGVHYAIVSIINRDNLDDELIILVEVKPDDQN